MAELKLKKVRKPRPLDEAISRELSGSHQDGEESNQEEHSDIETVMDFGEEQQGEQSVSVDVNGGGGGEKEDTSFLSEVPSSLKTSVQRLSKYAKTPAKQESSTQGDGKEDAGEQEGGQHSENLRDMVDDLLEKQKEEADKNGQGGGENKRQLYSCTLAERQFLDAFLKAQEAGNLLGMARVFEERNDGIELMLEHTVPLIVDGERNPQYQSTLAIFNEVYDDMKNSALGMYKDNLLGERVVFDEEDEEEDDGVFSLRKTMHISKKGDEIKIGDTVFIKKDAPLKLGGLETLKMDGTDMGVVVGMSSSGAYRVYLTKEDHSFYFEEEDLDVFEPF